MAALLCTLATEILEDAHPIAVRGQNGRLSIPQRRRIAAQLSLAARRLSAISELLLSGWGAEPTALERPTGARQAKNKVGRHRE